MKTSRKAPRTPPLVNQHRAAIHGDVDWLYPDNMYGDRKRRKEEGPAVCERCHAFLETDHWRYNERLYREIKERPDVHVTLCPGCLRVERRLYEGEVIIRHDWRTVDKDEIRHLIHNEEARERATNAAARIAVLDDRGDELYILTTTQFLARRIGEELKKAYKGELTLSHLPHEAFIRVRWCREEANPHQWRAA